MGKKRHTNGLVEVGTGRRRAQITGLVPPDTLAVQDTQVRELERCCRIPHILRYPSRPKLGVLLRDIVEFRKKVDEKHGCRIQSAGPFEYQWQFYTHSKLTAP